MNGQNQIRSDMMNKKFLAFLVGVIFVLQTVASVYADNIDESNPKDEADVETISAQCSVDQNDIVSYGDSENVLNLTAAESGTDFTKVSGSYTTDITKPYEGNWHILSWKDNFKAGCSNWDYNGNYHMGSESAFEYITGGIPNGSGITKFSIDVTNRIYEEKYVDIYVSDSLDGKWTKCDYTVADNVTDNDQNATMTGGNLRKRITFNFDKSNGYRYIKVSRVAAPENAWAYELGGFSFSWDGIPDVTVDYAKDGNSLKATVKLVNQSDFLPFIVFAGYDSEGTLLKASYHSEGLLNGSKKIEYVIPSKDISKSRLFVWNQENLSPAATLGDFNAAK